jgi:hypothetical protein
MVDVRDKTGKLLYREPPYTEEEELELYRQFDGPMTILHGPRPSVPQSPPEPVKK